MPSRTPKYEVRSGTKGYPAATVKEAKEKAAECMYATIVEVATGKTITTRVCASCGATGMLNDSKKLPLCDDCDEEMRVELAALREEF